MNAANFEEFTRYIQVMKPAHIDEDNPKHLQRMEQILQSPDYVAEEKIDGCHYLCFGGRFMSTDNVEKTANYPHLQNFFQSLQMPQLILDGEINYPGKTSQFCTRVTGSAADVARAFQNDYGMIHYTMWDILRTPKGTWLLNLPYIKRREILVQFYNHFIKGSSMEQFIHVTRATRNNKKEFFDSIINAGLEGCVIKRIDSLYVMGKKPQWQWIKLKQKDTADLFISGYKAPTAEYKGSSIENWPYWKDIKGVLRPVTKDYYMNWPGALELSAYVNGQVVQICTCSGLTESLKAAIAASPEAYVGRVVKISYMEKTEAGNPRHPRFEMFHESKTARECTWNFEE
jgi:hypothetical protein